MNWSRIYLFASVLLALGFGASFSGVVPFLLGQGGDAWLHVSLRLVSYCAILALFVMLGMKQPENTWAHVGLVFAIGMALPFLLKIATILDATVIREAAGMEMVGPVLVSAVGVPFVFAFIGTLLGKMLRTVPFGNAWSISI